MQMQEIITERARIGRNAAMLAAAAMIGGAAIGFNWPDQGAARSYDLVKVNGGESDVVDYGQTATDCGLKLEAMRRSGISGFCEVAR